MQTFELKAKLCDGIRLMDSEKMIAFQMLTPGEFNWWTVKACFSMTNAEHNFIIMQEVLKRFGDRNLYKGYLTGDTPINKAILDLVIESGVRNKTLIKNIISNTTITAKDLEAYREFKSGMHIFAWLSRKDCPSDLILEFSYNKCERNRIKIAGHPNTPRDVLVEYMNKDISAKVRKRAVESLVKRNFM